VLDDVIAYHVAHEGISRIEKIFHCHKNFLGIELSEDQLAELAVTYSALVKQVVINCDSVPGALDFLEEHSADQDIVEGRGLSHHFTSVHGSPPHKAPIVNERLQLHGLDRNQCLFVGDAMTDYVAAKDTGLAFIGRVGQGHANPFPEGTTIITDLTQLTL
jgi:hypothetical protein